jgi:hypothetical protein
VLISLYNFTIRPERCKICPLNYHTEEAEAMVRQQLDVPQTQACLKDSAHHADKPQLLQNQA